ncbi:MAG: DUF1634 domain-containing protein [Candidatus Omnitrophica bacterium]|nr:DUF1634 domain-containing protein [Candidatus Omnitrophota bacterium]
MNKTNGKFTNHEMEVIIGNLLRAGVIIAAAVVFAGGLIYLLRHANQSPDYRVFAGEPPDLCSIAGILKNSFALRGRGLIQLGLLFLIATPVARVALSIFAFARQRDTLYIVVTSVVFVILIYSLFGR